MNARRRRQRRHAALALSVALSAFGCRALVGIEDLSVVESAGSAGADATGGADSASGGSTSAGGHAGGGELAGAAGRAGAGGTLGQAGVAGQSPTAGAGGKAQAGGSGVGGAPPECGGDRGPCQMCCHTAHMAANGTLDQYLRTCACQASTCQSMCPSYCTPNMPESSCIDCLINLVKAPTCDALSQCAGNTSCAPLAKCMEACP